MEFNNKKLEKTSKLINYIIALVLCGFLISLSSRLMDDVDDWKERPSLEDFQDHSFIAKQNAEIAKIDEKIAIKNEKKTSVETTLSIVKSNYNDAKKSYDNWLQARITVGSPNEDKEILSRANELDAFFKTKQDWNTELLKISAEVDSIKNIRYKLENSISENNNIAYSKLNAAYREYDMKVFLIRLLFILPILIIGIIFILKFRKHKYWPLFLGFVLFSFYLFFFGLVPYLPSYGGYIRYTVGIILSVAFGIYFINKIKAFIEKKKSELKVSSTERAKSVQTETAEKALDSHMCPSCGKDFIIKPWDKSNNNKKKIQTDGLGLVTNFCRFCGLELFKECKSCGAENFAHLPFCSNCGDKLMDSKE